MHGTSTLAAFVLAAVLGAHYFAFERPLPEGDEITREPLTTLAVEDIIRVEVARAGAAPIVLSRAAGTSKWRLGDDPSAEVDPQLVYAIYRALHEHTVLTSWDGATEEYGLAGTPPLRVTLSDGARSEWLGFGAKDPGGQRRYLLKGAGAAPESFAGRTRIGIAARTAADAFDHAAEDWRDRRLLRRADAERNVRRIEVRVGELQHALVLEQDRWRLDPGGERVRREVDGQVAALLSARHEAARPARGVAQYAKLTVHWADESAPWVIDIGPLEDERGYWVAEPGADNQRFIARSQLEWILGGPDELRALELVAGKSGHQYLARIEVASGVQPPLVVAPQQGPGGARKFALESPGTLAGYSPLSALRLARALDAARIFGRHEGEATPELLAKLELSPPAATYAVLRRWAERGRDREATTAIQVGRELEGGVVVRVDGGAIYMIDVPAGRILRGGALGLRTGRVLDGVELLRATSLLFVDRRDPADPKHFDLRRKQDAWFVGEARLAPQAFGEILAGLDAAEVDRYEPPGLAGGVPAPYEIALTVDAATIVLGFETLPGDECRVTCTRDGVTLSGVASQVHAQVIAALLAKLSANATPKGR